MDARWEQKDARQEDKNAEMIDMIQNVHDDVERDRNRNKDERRDVKTVSLVLL